MNVTKKLGQEHCVVTCDQAIYEIVHGLKNKHTDRYKSLILHIAFNFMGAIGHLMKSSGIEDILVKANACGSGTANKIMARNNYYKTLRAHSLILAAFFEIHWSLFHHWLIYKDDEECGDLDYVALFLENVTIYIIQKGCVLSLGRVAH